MQLGDRSAGGGGGVNGDRVAELEDRLRELQHRINNSLQMIVSLLQLQAQRATPDVERALAAARGRVAAIGTLYEALDENDDADIDLAGRVGRLVELQQAIAPESIALEYVRSAEPCLVRPSAAISLLIVVNELITNAVQHAFPPGRGGTIVVQFDGRGNNFRISVTDDGIGTEWSRQMFDSGLKIASGLTERAGGCLVHVGRDAGTCVELRFNASRLQ